MVKADVGLTIIINVNDRIRNPICTLAESSKSYLNALDFVLGLRIFTDNVSSYSLYLKSVYM